jgi:hypothetical protein
MIINSFLRNLNKFNLNSVRSSFSHSRQYRPWGAVGLSGWGALGGKCRAEGARLGPSERTVRLFSIEVTLDQTLGNWYHLMKPIHCIKNLLTVKEL